MLELILALIIGIAAGTFTGLAPGIHINLVAAILLSSIASFPSVSLMAAAVFIAAMSITHTFLDFIPSIYLGAPEEDTFLSVLPGHQLLKDGKGHEAVVLTLYGSLAALIIILIFTPIFIYFLPNFYNAIKMIIPFLLIFISLYIIFREDKFLLSLSVFFLAGFLGLITFNLPIKDPLLPLLSGLFGTSALLVSVKDKPIIQSQQISSIKDIKLTKQEFFKAAIAATIAAPLCSFLPGIGSGHAATIGSEIIPQERRGFLFLVGAINTIIIALSFVTIYAIDKARSGTAAAVKDILKTISLNDLTILIVAMIIAGITSFLIGISISKLFANSLNKINYQTLTKFVIVILFVINIIFTNWLGLIVLVVSTSLGVFAILSDSKRINLMAALILPAIVYYLTN